MHRFLFTSALLALTGCLSTKPPEKTDLSAITFWKPELLFLNRAPHDSLYVEVDALEGAEPGNATLKALEDFLRQHCDKPGGITLRRDDVIPRAAAIGYHHDALALQYLDGPPLTNNPGPAFIYVLYYDSDLTSDPTAPRKPVHKHLSLKAASRYTSPENPHVHLLPYPAAIYVDRRYLRTIPRSFEPLAVCHEAAHLLGLARNEAHSAELHCRSETCLMNSSLSMKLGKFLLGQFPFTQTNLCNKCHADVLTAAAERPPSNLRFLGPTLVRSERDYHVASLPSEAKLFTGDLSSFNTPKFIDQARADGKEIKGSFPGRFWFDFAGQPSQIQAQLSGITQARTDHIFLVRYGATQIVARAESLLPDRSSPAPDQATTTETKK